MLRNVLTFRFGAWPQLAPKALTAMVWCLAAAGAGYWALHFPWQTPTPMADTGLATAAVAVDASQVARALGGAPSVVAAPQEAKRYQLLGVIAATSGRGSALIAVDGQAPKAVRVGQRVEDGVFLQSTGPREALLGQEPQGNPTWVLALPGAQPKP